MGKLSLSLKVTMHIVLLVLGIVLYQSSLDAAQVNQVHKNKIKLALAQGKKIRKVNDEKHRQTCPSGVTNGCLEAAKDVLFFEAYQRNNFLKQFARFASHNKTSVNKLKKKGIFASAKKHLEDATGGNISSVSCHFNPSSVDSFLSNYLLLSNCSNTVNEACNITMPDTATLSAMDKCFVEMDKTKKLTEDCRKLNKDGAAQCSCWETVKKDNVDLIKSFLPKCTGMQKIAKQMKQDNKKCVAAFSKCKKAEDASVKMIGDCMWFETQGLDQAQIAIEAGSEIIG